MGTKGNCWDNPKPLKVSGVLLTSFAFVVSQRRRFGFTYNGEEYYYIKNVQNDVVAIADKNGDIVANNTAYTSVKLHLGLAKLVEAHSTCY